MEGGSQVGIGVRKSADKEGELELARLGGGMKGGGEKHREAKAPLREEV